MQDQPNPEARSGASSFANAEQHSGRMRLHALPAAPPPESSALWDPADDPQRDVDVPIDVRGDGGLAERKGDPVRPAAAAPRFDLMCLVRS